MSHKSFSTLIEVVPQQLQPLTLNRTMAVGTSSCKPNLTPTPGCCRDNHTPCGAAQCGVQPPSLLRQLHRRGVTVHINTGRFSVGGGTSVFSAPVSSPGKASDINLVEEHEEHRRFFDVTKMMLMFRTLHPSPNVLSHKSFAFGLAFNETSTRGSRSLSSCSVVPSVPLSRSVSSKSSTRSSSLA